MHSLAPANFEKLSTAQAAHLLRRTTWGATPQEINAFAQKSLTEAVTALLQTPATAPAPPVDPATGQPWLNEPFAPGQQGLEPQRKAYVGLWWLHQMNTAPATLQERMVWFWHTHYTTKQSRIAFSKSLYYQLALFRHYALGNVKALARKMCTDNAMLQFLDGGDNDKANPNENFGREFLELYTVGKGEQLSADDYTNYTEQDVREAARVLSGWAEDAAHDLLDEDTGLPRGFLRPKQGTMAQRHDTGTKTFSAAFGNTSITTQTNAQGQATKQAVLQELDQFIDMLFAPPAANSPNAGQPNPAAMTLCRRLYRFFVHYDITPAVEATIITGLAQTLVNNDYEVAPVLRQLLESQHFWDLDVATNQEAPRHLAALFKGPLELSMGILRFFKVPAPDIATQPEAFYNFYAAINNYIAGMGLDLYEPFEVAGYAAYHQAPTFNRNWISGSTLGQRYEFAQVVLTAMQGADVVQFVAQGHLLDTPELPEPLVQAFVQYLIPQPITTERFDYFLHVQLLDQLPIENWGSEWTLFSGGGPDDVVRSQLVALTKSILQSPEYQLF